MSITYIEKFNKHNNNMKRFNFILIAIILTGNTFAQHFTSSVYDTEIFAREGHEVIFFNNYFWLMGGRAQFQDSTSNDLWRSSDGINWEKMFEHTAWDTRMNFNLFTFQNKLWIVGGYSTRDANGNIYPSLDDPLYWKGDIWNSDNGLDWIKVIDYGPWETRLSSAVSIFNDKLFLIGGHSTTNWHLFQDIYESDDGETWNKIGEIEEDTIGTSQERQGLFEHDIIEFNNKLFLLGGSRASEFNLFNWVLESTDGLDWSIATKEPYWKDETSSLPLKFLRPFVFNNKLWAIVANELLFSEDGIIWEKEMDLPIFNNNELRNPRTIIKDNSLYIYGSYSVLWGERDTVVHVIKLDANSTNVENIFSPKIMVYPNPVANTLYLKNLKGAYHYRISDISGKIILEENSYDKNFINIEFINKGIYILQIKGINNNLSFNSKFIKK